MQIFQNTPLNLNDDDFPSLDSAPVPKKTQKVTKRPRFEDLLTSDPLNTSASTNSSQLEQPDLSYCSKYQFEIVQPLVTLNFLDWMSGHHKELPCDFLSCEHYQKEWGKLFKQEVWNMMLN